MLWPAKEAAPKRRTAKRVAKATARRNARRSAKQRRPQAGVVAIVRAGAPDRQVHHR
jgi:hypothetical protein